MAAIAVALVAHAAGLLSGLERLTVDARFTIRGSEPAPRDIVLIEVDNHSLGQLPRFPFSRKFYVPVIRRVRAGGARVIAFDIEFDRPTTAAADNALIDAVARARPMVFATTLIGSHGSNEVLGGPSVQ